MELDFKGIDELLKALDDVGINSEKKVRNHLNKQGRNFIATAKENTPEGKTGKLKDSYVNMRVVKNFNDYDKPIRNKAPHHHLVNNGHNLVKRGKTIGYVPGQYYIEKTVAQKEDEFTQDTRDWLDDLYKELLKWKHT